MKKNIIAITITLLVTIAGALTLVQCDHSNMARVTIHIQNEMYAQKSESIIDKILNIISTKAYATTGWSSAHGEGDGLLNLYVSGPDIQQIEASVPPLSESYTIEVPAGYNRNIKLIFSTTIGDVHKTWGSEKTLMLSPGDNDINLTMLPMTEIIATTNFTTAGRINLNWYNTSAASSVIGYRIYRSTNADSNFSLINTILDPIDENTTDDVPTSGIVYYYKISVITNNAEGLLSDSNENSYAIAN